MQFFVLGLNHKTAPIQLREKFSILDESLATTAQRIRQAGLQESFVVSTCNRVELYGAGHSVSGLGESLGHILADVGQTSLGKLVPHVYEHSGGEAIHHLFRVAASLDSMIVGEPQILGQLKSAYSKCRKAGVTGPLLNRAVERAFSVAKKVRSETGIGEHAISISSVAIQLARQIFGQLDDKKAALVGAGKMGQLAARHIRDAGISQLYVANRSFERAQALSNELQGHPRYLNELGQLLSLVDIVITSTASKTHLVDVKMMKTVMKARKYRPIFFIDIAVPRNVCPDLNQMDNVYVYDVDDLNGISNENKETRATEARLAEAVVFEQAQRFIGELSGLALKPTIMELKEQIAVMKASEVDKFRRRLTSNGSLDEELMGQLADGLLNKVLHGALTELKKQAAEGNSEQSIGIIRRIFGLDERSQ
ncbi:MAG: glutamyl-tRNA reductase [Myxococcales bacterium]|nr:glutamyl-tRNA reductase [Myxococcales bacterium]